MERGIWDDPNNVSQLGILENTERSKKENKRLRDDRRYCRFTVQ